MNISKAERLQIENEMIFRRTNEKVGDDLGALDAMHVEDGNVHLLTNEDLTLRFRCECSDENCSLRIPMLQSDYDKIHVDRDTFIVMPNHQVEPIEKIVRSTHSYNIVRKNNSTAEPNDTLNTTTIDNSK